MLVVEPKVITGDLILDACLVITGTFENGTPSYTATSGDFDGQGISMGLMQWCAGQGSLGKLIAKAKELGMTAQEIDACFTTPVSTLDKLSAKSALTFVYRFLEGGKKGGKLTKEAKAQWECLLGKPKMIEAQIAMSSATLDRAKTLTARYMPPDMVDSRSIVFFFDLLNQSGGMKDVQPTTEFKSAETAIQFIGGDSKYVKNAKFWRTVVDLGDRLSIPLLHYAYERARLSLPEWQTNALARRGTIACRVGYVNKTEMDFTKILA